MPGPTGGGRSGGGGGIGGGARGGGFTGGSHGSFSSSSHNTFRSGVHRPAGGFYHNNDPDDEKQGKNIGRVILIIILAVIFCGPVLSMVGNVFSDLSSPVVSPDIWAEVDSAFVMQEDEWDNEYYIIPVEGYRTKLDESLCTPVGGWYLDRIGLFGFSQEQNDVENALAYFYEKTGVQPFLVTARSINGELDPDWDTVDAYLYDLYIELFGEDEGHYIFLYFMHEDESYTLYYMPGWDAMTVVDDNASAILMDYIEWYYQESSSYGEMFASAFADAADAIMCTPEADTSLEPADSDYAEMSTYPPASTVPAVEVDSSEDLTVPVVELTNEVESVEPESVVESTGATVEVTYHEEIEITYYEEPDSDFVWDEDVTDQAVEHYITTDTLKYIAGGFVILLAVILFVVYILWDKKKMRDLEEDM